jgi:hypothetical protein
MSAICSHTASIELTELGGDRRVPGVPGDRRHVGAPAHVPDLRPDRVLRQLPAPACLGPRPPSQHPIARSAEPGEDWSTFVVIGR